MGLDIIGELISESLDVDAVLILIETLLLLVEVLPSRDAAGLAPPEAEKDNDHGERHEHNGHEDPGGDAENRGARHDPCRQR